MKGDLYIIGSAIMFSLSVWLLVGKDNVERAVLMMLIAILFNLRAIYFKEER